MSNQTSKVKPSKGFFIPELILTILAGICFIYAAISAHSAIQLLESGNAGAIFFGSVITLTLYIAATLMGSILAIPAVVLSAIGVKKYNKATSQIILLVFACVILVTLIALFAYTISYR